MSELQEIIDVATEVYILAATIFDRHSDVAKNDPKTPTENKKSASDKKLSSNLKKSWRNRKWTTRCI